MAGLRLPRRARGEGLRPRSGSGNLARTREQVATHGVKGGCGSGAFWKVERKGRGSYALAHTQRYNRRLSTSFQSFRSVPVPALVKLESLRIVPQLGCSDFGVWRPVQRRWDWNEENALPRLLIVPFFRSRRAYRSSPGLFGLLLEGLFFKSWGVKSRGISQSSQITRTKHGG